MINLKIDLLSDQRTLSLTDDIPVLNIRLCNRKRSLELVSKAPSEIPGPCLIAHPVDVHPAHREDREREKDDEYKREQIERICVALENDSQRVIDECIAYDHIDIVIVKI